MVGWGGCECDGLVSNTLSLSMSTTSTHPQSAVTVQCVFFHNQILWASARVPAGSVPATQSQKREVGTIALWPHARACQSSVFQSHCVCCHFNQCVGAAVLSHFCPLSNLLLIGNCHLCVVCTMSCVCVGFVGVCCVMSSDGVWGVDDAVCVSLSTPKKGSIAHGHVCK